MDHEAYFKSHDDADFFERRWAPDGDVRANLVLVHGYGEHCTRYAAAAHALNRSGITVHTYDQRGFGRSPGKRAYIDDFDALLADLDTYLAHIGPLLEGKPWFMMGHSMGGLVLAAYAETRDIGARGLVFSSPFLAFSDDVPKFLLALANILGKVTPWVPVGGVDNSRLSRDPKAVEAADNDPLSYHGRVLARTGAQFNAAITRTRAAFQAITAPAYIIHGSDDGIVPPEGSRLLHAQCRSEDKTLKIYDGGYHELWNDLIKDEVIAGIADWITARL